MIAVNLKGVRAVVGMTKTAALELAPRGIRVNAICPAPIETSMAKALESVTGPVMRERLTATLPLGIYTVDGGAMA